MKREDGIQGKPWCLGLALVGQFAIDIDRQLSISQAALEAHHPRPSHKTIQFLKPSHCPLAYWSDL